MKNSPVAPSTPRRRRRPPRSVPASSGERGASLRIGLVGATYPPLIGGQEVYLREVGQALARLGHMCLIASYTFRSPGTR